jgi:hypothetical protein
MRWSARFAVSLIGLWTHLLYLALAQQKPAFEARPFEDVESFRQNVCDRAVKVESGEVELRESLEGLQLRPIMGDPNYFNLDLSTGGIDATYPGLIAVLLDELARRAGFTWRDSYGVIQNAEGNLKDVVPPNRTWTEVLAWSVDQYDLSASWWPANQERMNLGVTFMEPWYDSSIILIGKEYPPEDTNEVNLWNWLRPYHNTVWYLVLATIFLSALVHQWLEWMADEREGRTFKRWTADCMYTSLLNFTQNYEYQPRNAAGRLFGVSMAIWALVSSRGVQSSLDSRSISL